MLFVMIVRLINDYDDDDDVCGGTQPHTILYIIFKTIIFMMLDIQKRKRNYNNMQIKII